MATAKSEPSVAAKGEPASGAAPGTPPSSASGVRGTLLPVLAVVVLAPLLTWVTVEFLVLPRLRQKIAVRATAEPAAAAPAEGGHGGKSAKDAKSGQDGVPGTYEFQNVVVNLAGTMGTRYLKTTFLVTARKDVDIKSVFEGAKPRLTDVTLNVLSSLTLADLEEPGAKNVIREKLVGAYNQALGRKVADQVYFSDFVIQ